MSHLIFEPSWNNSWLCYSSYHALLSQWDLLWLSIYGDVSCVIKLWKPIRRKFIFQLLVEMIKIQSQRNIKYKNIDYYIHTWISI